MTLSKDFAFTERFHFKLAADAFNVLNHPNFSNPGTVRLSQAIPTAPGAANTIQPGTPFSLTSSGIGTFGQLSTTVGNQVGVGANRQIQLSGRLNF
jgi:hypothetical protein